MKKKGVTAKYYNERIADIWYKYSRVSSGKKQMQMSAFEDISLMPTRRFWVSEERAYFVVKAMLDGAKLPRMCKSKTEMYTEIATRVKRLMAEDDTLSVFDACCKVVTAPAPKLYLSPLTVRAIILSKWRKEYKRKI